LGTPLGKPKKQAKKSAKSLLGALLRISLSGAEWSDSKKIQIEKLPVFFRSSTGL
jgi:hypothetical protein